MTLKISIEEIENAIKTLVHDQLGAQTQARIKEIHWNIDYDRIIEGCIVELE